MHETLMRRHYTRNGQFCILLLKYIKVFYSSSGTSHTFFNTINIRSVVYSTITKLQRWSTLIGGGLLLLAMNVDICLVSFYTIQRIRLFLVDR